MGGGGGFHIHRQENKTKTKANKTKVFGLAKCWTKMFSRRTRDKQAVRLYWKRVVDPAEGRLLCLQHPSNKTDRRGWNLLSPQHPSNRTNCTPTAIDAQPGNNRYEQPSPSFFRKKGRRIRVIKGITAKELKPHPPPPKKKTDAIMF